MSSKPKADLVLVGEILSPHGVRGLVKVRHFCESAESFLSFNPFVTEKGLSVTLSVNGGTDSSLICKVKGIDDRTAAEKLKSTGLYVQRERLPEEDEGEFYLHDLIGMQCRTSAGVILGKVVAVHNFGASDIVEIKPEYGAENLMFAFTEETFPEIDIENKVVTVSPPEEV